ncbi:Hint domain-containing protein [Paracoccus sp. KR1-242]|uniref:Hint domain-containing protein n=1 Tax=Paracoccus sp. KR1-242 TaxID=3410028 RepID=UPI003BFCBB05
MPINLSAWNVELTELGDHIPGWTFDSSVYGSSGPAYDLSANVIQVTLTDNGDGTIAVNTGDTVTIDGVPQAIGLIYYGDTVVIDGTTIQTVTMYVGPDNQVPVVFPIIDGKITNAFGGDITRSEGTASFNTPIPLAEFACFARGTLIGTERGPVAVELLREGDLVRTRDHGLQPIRWTGSARLGGARLGIPAHLHPVRIRAGALGEGVPSADLLVSPQHRVLVRSRIAQRMFGTDELLVAAKHLLGLDGVEIATDLRAVEYFHILFDRHEIVSSNGAETESLFTGPEALKSVGPQARDEILALFPELAAGVPDPVPARMLVPGRMARRLVERHVGNRKPLS